ncbi:1373_t:CDS:2 [Entrophospora sp. SA101]|nr:1373_t:CDS:2 [Entrophospora sp. SA101]
MSQGTSRRNRDNYWEEVKGTDPGYRSRSVRICVQALKSILEVMDEMDVAKLNKVYEDNEARFSKLEDELDEIEKLKRRRIRCFYVVDSGSETLEEVSN